MVGQRKERQDSSTDEMELWQRIRTIYRTAIKRLNSMLAKEMITFSQYSVLVALSRNGPMQMNRLGEHMLVAPANVTGLINRMEQKGYVKRRRGRDDRRLYVIEPTDSGSRIFKIVSSRFRHYTGRLGSDLTKAELAVTLRALGKVQRRVEAATEL